MCVYVFLDSCCIIRDMVLNDYTVQNSDSYLNISMF